ADGVGLFDLTGQEVPRQVDVAAVAPVAAPGVLDADTLVVVADDGDLVAAEDRVLAATGLVGVVGRLLLGDVLEALVHREGDGDRLAVGERLLHVGLDLVAGVQLGVARQLPVRGILALGVGGLGGVVEVTLG